MFNHHEHNSFKAPTVSQIWSLICFPSMLIIRAPNSTPMVRSCTGWNLLSVNWSSRQDLPTPVWHRAGREINLYWPTCVPDDDVLEQVAVGHGCWFVKEGGRHHRELLVGEQLLCVTWDWRRRMRRRNYRKNRLLPSFLTVSPPPRLGSLLRSATGCAIVLPPVTGGYGQEDTRDKERKCSGFLPFFVLPATELRASLPLLFTLTTEKLFAAFSLGPTIPFAKRSIQKQPMHCNALQSWPNCIARHSMARLCQIKTKTKITPLSKQMIACSVSF